MFNPKRTQNLSPEQVQQGNQNWWTEHPMTYDWRGQIEAERYSREWFDAIDAAHIYGLRLFATDQQPFDRIMPLQTLHGAKVLEIGCGMGLHTETMIKAGANVTAIDITPTAVEATTKRLKLKGLQATVQQVDAEHLPFGSGEFDFVWSWGVIHHSANTGRIVRNIANVLTPQGECRVMVYNREGTSARLVLFKDHLLKGGFLKKTIEETLYAGTDGFSARYYIREQFEDLFRAFFQQVSSEICGLDVDALPLPSKLRRIAVNILPLPYLKAAQARRGGFIFLQAVKPNLI